MLSMIYRSAAERLAAVVGKKVGVFVYSACYIPFIIVGWLSIANHSYWPFLFVLLALPRASFLPSILKKTQQADITFLMLRTIKLEVLFALLLTIAGIGVFYLTWPLGSLSASTIFAIPF